MTRHGFLLQSLTHRGMRQNQVKFHLNRAFRDGSDDDDVAADDDGDFVIVNWD
jgi:hypothetical protein